MRLAPVALLAAVVTAGACPGPQADGTTPEPVAVQPAPVPIDAPEATQEERLAAIQKAMNELDEGVQLCWAAAATERFDIEGEIIATIDIVAGAAQVSIARDTAQNPKLAACVTALLSKYTWAPPLHGQAIQLPFRFRAPDGQNVIDRSLVAAKTQGKTSVAVLLDENNSGNAAASMFEVALDAGTSTGMRRAERAELWYFRAWKPDEWHELELAVSSPGGRKQQARGGDMMYVPAGAARELGVTRGTLRAVVVMLPGGREGTARAGTLPTPEVTTAAAATPAPVIVRSDAVKPTGPARIFVEPATVKGAGLSASILTLPGGTNVAEHVHAKETEMLFVMSGSGTLTVNGVALEVGQTSVIQIPPGTKHSFIAARDVAALQIYTPAGPEQRFKAKP